MKEYMVSLHLIYNKTPEGRQMKKFSLMELLVVMGILLLMMSLLLPVVAPMMNRAELNKTVTTIIGQLEVGFLKSFDKNQVTRVSFEYDPMGKNITKPELASITGASVSSDADELAARQSLTGSEFDINNDGISSGYMNKQFFWIKAYLCSEQCKNGGAALDTVAEIRASALGDGVEDAVGPYWFRRPISRVKDSSGNFKPTYINIKPIWNEGKNKRYYYRFVKNEGLDMGGPEKLMEINGAIGDGTCDLIKDTGAKMDYNLTTSEMRTYVGPLNTTYDQSVAMYKAKGGTRYSFIYGAAIDAWYQAKPAGPPDERVYNNNTEWFDVFEGDFVDPKNLDFGYNDDEDKLIDEGMSVSVESYNQSEYAPPVVLDRTKTPPIVYLNYFSGIEDHNLKIGREYFVGGKDKKGIMLRRVWGVKPGKPNKELLWSFNQILKPGGDFANVKMTVPYHFYIVFDQKNGRSGMSFGTTFGSEQVEKLYFQVSDDDGKLYTIIEFADGIAKEGNLTEMGFPTSKAGLDALGYYQGAQ